MIEDALRESLGRRASHPAGLKRKLPTFRGQGLYPGVNLDDSAALLELMEGERDSHRRQRADLVTCHTSVYTAFARLPARIFTNDLDRNSSKVSPVANASSSVNAPLLIPRMK